MMIDREKEKMIQAMIFFIKKTRHCYKLKLFKLLYFLDFRHFKQTGRSVTGLEYFAWPMGPVPRELCEKLKNQAELKDFFKFIPESYFDSDFSNDKAVRIVPKAPFDKTLFSKRELRIMKELADIYRSLKSKDMTAISHDKKEPWHKVFKEENKPRQIIPYKYALDGSPGSISIEEAEEKVREDREMRNMFDFQSSV